ncbi:hypothetical protein DRN69_01885 [Candidatus Pacearchaeota archaeon]|nr:MAG: hypothetical protein DRN69_01885 [Candidatus Pacearchaeota archaeon]
MITAEKSLKGRPIGLKISMSKEEMKNHLITKKQEWLKEGFTEEEVLEAIWVKCKPLGLVSNFYWNRYPESSERLRLAFEELEKEGILKSYETITDSFKKLRKVLKRDNKNTEFNSNKITKIKDFLNQF